MKMLRSLLAVLAVLALLAAAPLAHAQHAEMAAGETHAHVAPTTAWCARPAPTTWS